MAEDGNDTAELLHFRLKVDHGEARTALAGLVK